MTRRSRILLTFLLVILVILISLLAIGGVTGTILAVVLSVVIIGIEIAYERSLTTRHAICRATHNLWEYSTSRCLDRRTGEPVST